MARFSVNGVAQETHFFTKKLTPRQMLNEITGGGNSNVITGKGDDVIYDLDGELVIEFDNVTVVKSLEDLVA